MRKIPFIKGHMGGNEIVLINRNRLSSGEELEESLSILRKPNVRGDQAGLLYQNSDSHKLRAKIVDINSSDYLSMCGGLTQVLGKAYSQFDLADILELSINQGESTIELETDLGSFNIKLAQGSSGGRVQSEMNPFVKDIYERGVQMINVSGVDGYWVGDFLVEFLPELKRTYGFLDLDPINDRTKDTLIEFQQEFSKKYLDRGTNRDFTIVDFNRDGSPGRLLFPHNLEKGLTEPSCGTGTVAALIAALHGELIELEGDFELGFKSGGRGDRIGGPHRTSIIGTVSENLLIDAWLTHDNVEILASGTLYL